MIEDTLNTISRPCGFPIHECMSSQIFLCAAGVPSYLLNHGALRLRFSLDETSFGKNGGQDTDILSSGVVCKNSDNWEWSCPSKELDPFCSLMNIILKNLRNSLSVPSSSAWIAGYDSTSSGISDSWKFTTFLGLWQFHNQIFPFLDWFPKVTTSGEILLLPTLLKISPHSPEVSFP